jgi:hypothetical protein
MKGTGKMICRMDRELRLGLMDLDMRVFIKMGRNMEWVDTPGVMALDMRESGSIIRSTGTEYIPG